MGTATISAETTMTFKHRDWDFIPDVITPNRFNVKENKTGKILGTIILPENCDTTFLNLIGCAPELQDIAEMYRDKMKGSKEEKTMVFSIVMEVLQRIHTQ